VEWIQVEEKDQEGEYSMRFWRNVVEYQLVGPVEVDFGEMMAMMDLEVDVDYRAALMEDQYQTVFGNEDDPVRDSFFRSPTRRVGGRIFMWCCVSSLKVSGNL
jgi:hypothetical protein